MRPTIFVNGTIGRFPRPRRSTPRIILNGSRECNLPPRIPRSPAQNWDRNDVKEENKLILYDIPSNLSQKAWSPNVWKARFCLNYLRIPYKTEWIEYPDIADHCKKLGIPPTTKDRDGSPIYTLPALFDPLADLFDKPSYVSDSLSIAKYIERNFNNDFDTGSKRLFPDATYPLQVAFVYAFRQQMGSMWQFVYAPEVTRLNPRSAEYFRLTREKKFGRTLEDMVPKGKEGEVEWAKFKDGLGKVDAWYSMYEKSESLYLEDCDGPFFLGKEPSWADFVVASHVIWWRTIWGEDSGEWKDIASWHDGRWSTLLDELKIHQEVV